MECPPTPSVVVPALTVLVLVMMAAQPGMALKLEPSGTSVHIPPLLDCAPPSPAARSTDNHSAFRGNVLALLGALSAGTAAPASTGLVADAQSGGAVGDDDRAFARAFCFRRSVPRGCLECLSTAAQDVADGCHGRRRGAVWRAGCFLSYADTNASTAREDAWRGWFYDDGDDTPASSCVANRTAAECSRCLDESAKVVPALKKEGRRRRQVSLLHRNSVVVVGYSCYMRVPIIPPTAFWRVWVYYAVGGFALGVVLGIEISVVRFGIRIAQQFNLAA